MRILPATSLLLLCAPLFAHAQEASTSGPAREGVHLVVVLNVDSMIPEQLDRLNPWWTGGMRRLMDGGTRFVDAALPYANTESAVGHASFATGCWPAKHGITRDALIDPQSARWTPAARAGDANTVSSSDWNVEDSGSASGARMRVDGWAAALREEWPASRSISIGGRGSSAALLGGRSVELALWWDSYGRGFVSSTAYTEQLPAWLATWNQVWPARAHGWDWVADLPADLQRMGTGADDRAGEAPVAGREPVFPYLAPPSAKGVEELDRVAQASLAGRVFVTPQMDRFVCEVAAEAVVQGGLGSGDGVDLLALSLSTCDLLGSATGPYSLETTDALLRVDQRLGELFDALDEQLGAQAWMVVLSSDHGLLELPEGGQGQSAGGVRLRVRARRLVLQLLRTKLLAEFEDDYGANLTASADGVIFGPGALQRAGSQAPAVRAAAARALRSVPWIADAYTREALMAEADAGDDPWLALARRSFRVAGGVEVEVRLAHRHLLGVSSGTRAGSPYLYDRRQPLVMLGPGFAALRQRGPASSVDALPTILARLGVALPEGLDGQDLLAGSDE